MYISVRISSFFSRYLSRTNKRVWTKNGYGFIVWDCEESEVDFVDFTMKCFPCHVVIFCVGMSQQVNEIAFPPHDLKLRLIRAQHDALNDLGMSYGVTYWYCTCNWERLLKVRRLLLKAHRLSPRKWTGKTRSIHFLLFLALDGTVVTNWSPWFCPTYCTIKSADTWSCRNVDNGWHWSSCSLKIAHALRCKFFLPCTLTSPPDRQKKRPNLIYPPNVALGVQKFPSSDINTFTICIFNQKWLLPW